MTGISSEKEKLGTEYKLFQTATRDLKRYWRKDTHALTKIKIIFLTQGIWVTLLYRLGAYLHQKKKRFLCARVAMPFCTVLHKIAEILTGISIPFTAHIGPGLYIGHFGCIIIGKDTVMGENCNISQGITIGQAGRGGRQLTPKLGNRIYIGPGAKIFGGIQIGDDVAIGANSVVTKSLPNKAVAVGIPAKIISYNSSKDFIVLN